jgi:ectoine hydroxylase-related dioxygenase (phytanoyl-CoA dioxygenase family)
VGNREAVTLMTAARKLTPENSKPTPVRLTENQIKEFYTKGFIVLRGLFTQPEVEEIKKSFDRLQNIAMTLGTTQEHMGAQFVVEGKRIDRIVWMGGAEPSLLKIGEDPRILLPVSQILETKTVEQLICQGHYKLPGDKVMFDWHQDGQHRGAGSQDWVDVDGRGSYCQTLMAIDEVTPENGPVCFVPDSVKLGYLGLEKQKDPLSLFDVNSAIPLLMQPGDVAFFHPYAIHGSQPNNSNGPRRVFINGFAYPGANKKQYPGKGAGRTVKLKL